MGRAHARAGLLGNPSDVYGGKAIAVSIPDWVAEFLAAGGNPDAPGDFVAWLQVRTPVYATPLLGRWFDGGDAETLARAREGFAR